MIISCPVLTYLALLASSLGRYLFRGLGTRKGHFIFAIQKTTTLKSLMMQEAERGLGSSSG
jgi:hypothetical protein